MTFLRPFFVFRPVEAQPDAANATASQPTPVNLLFLCHAIFVQAGTMLGELDKLETTLGLLKAAVPLLGHMSKPRAEVDATVQSTQRGVVRECLGTSLYSSVLTIWTILSWICAGIYMCGALPCPVCA